jgi:hypothetical protein
MWNLFKWMKSNKEDEERIMRTCPTCFRCFYGEDVPYPIKCLRCLRKEI